MSLFTFFKYLETLEGIKSINYDERGVIVFLSNFQKVLLSLSETPLKISHFYLETSDIKSEEFKVFLSYLKQSEKLLNYIEQDFRDFHTSLKIGYSIFHTVEDTFIIEFPDCNNKCYFCETHYTARIRKGFNYKNIVEGYLFFSKLKPIKAIDFFGGEPTIHKDFFPLLEYFSKNPELKKYLATHGRPFKNSEFIEKVRGKFDEIRISFHSIDEASFEKVTLVKNSYKETLEGLTNLYKAGFENVVVNTVVTNHNYDEVLTTIQKLYEVNPLLTFKVSGLIFSKDDTYENIHATYPGLVRMHALIHSQLLPFYAEKDIKKYQFEKLPLCLLEAKVPDKLVLGEKFRNHQYDSICSECPKKEKCTILPKIQLGYLEKNETEKVFFGELRKKFISYTV